MRTLTWFLGLMLLAAWHSIAAQLGNTATGMWWGFTVSWFFLGLAAGVAHAARWFIGKYKAAAQAPSLGTHASPPAVIRGEK